MAHVEQLPARPIRRAGRSFLEAARGRVPARVSPRTLRLAIWLVAIALAGLFALGVASNDLLVGSLDSLGDVDPVLLLAAILGEALSLGAYGLMVKRLLARVGIATEVRPLLGTTLAGVALASSIPAGAAASAVYWYRALRGYGANRGQATHVLVVITLVSIASLAALVALGAGLAEVDAVPGTTRAAILVGLSCSRRLWRPGRGPVRPITSAWPGSHRSTGFWTASPCTSRCERSAPTCLCAR